MEMYYLKEFVKLAESCNFQEAADELYISQSSLSKHIKKLETELGVSLFDRNARGVTLNDCGRIFESRARQIIVSWNECVAEVTAANERSRTRLTFGFSSGDGWQYNTSDLIVSFLEERPEIIVDMKHCPKMDILREELMNGKCDFAFSPDIMDEAGFQSIVYNVDTLALICSRNHPLSERPSITLGDLADEKFIMHDEVSNFYHNIKDACLKAGYLPNVIMTIASRGNLLKMIETGIGITIMYKQQAQALSSFLDLSYVDIEPRITRNIYLEYRDEGLTDIAVEFLEYFCDVTGQMKPEIR